MAVRVIYTLEVVEGGEDALREAWRQIVGAHGSGGALGSALLRPLDGPPGRLLAISRWESVASWEANRRDDAAPEAYARFRELAQVVSRTVCEEIVVIGAV